MFATGCRVGPYEYYIKGDEDALSVDAEAGAFSVSSGNNAQGVCVGGGICGKIRDDTQIAVDVL